jgi:hypothetical protein
MQSKMSNLGPDRFTLLQADAARETYARVRKNSTLLSRNSPGFRPQGSSVYRASHDPKSEIIINLNFRSGKSHA